MRKKDKKFFKAKSGVAQAYRYHNLSAAIALLVDIREETNRLTNWAGPQSREDTLEKIQKYIAEARGMQSKAAAKTVKIVSKNRMISLVTMAVLVIAGCAGIMITNSHDMSFAISMSFAVSLFVGGITTIPLWAIEVGKSTKPIGWEEMIESADDDD